MSLFRIHIRPGGGTRDLRKTFNYCLRERVLGVGWRTGNAKSTKAWDEYVRQAREHHPDLSQCKYIYDKVRLGDLVWTRDLDANYYLARVTSGWEYYETDFSSENDIDIANVFRCESMLKLALEDVPGSVINAFRARRSMQKIAAYGVEDYSKYLWNKFSHQNTYTIDSVWDIFALLDPEQMEDLVSFYLQSQGWYVAPSSRKVDTMRFEFMLVKSGSSKRAFVQVKTGNTSLRPMDYSDVEGHVFLSQANETYEGKSPINVTCISRSELQDFLEKSRAWLPRIFATKLDQVRVSPRRVEF